MRSAASTNVSSRALQRRCEMEACQRSSFPPGNAGERWTDAVHGRLIGMTGRTLRPINLLPGADIFTSEGRASRCGHYDREEGCG